ncbi:MAG: NAD(P)H-dependent oxidoreductase subunit E [Candidatus Woesearchaeota archaeon]
MEKFNYPDTLESSELINLLHEVQDKYNYIPKEVSIDISKKYDIPLSKIYSVISFYDRFKETNRGKYLIRVCLGTACSVKKGDLSLNLIKKTLGIDVGETTPDNLFTLETVNCVGACSLAPVIEINGKIYSNMDEEKTKKVIKKLKDEE